MGRKLAGEWRVDPPRRLGFMRQAGVLSLAVCMAATGGAVAWDYLHPWSHSMAAAISASKTVVPGTAEARGVAGRMQDLLAPGIQAVRAMQLRGDRAAGDVRSLFLHWLQQAESADITVEQIRRRLHDMPPQDFSKWLRETLR